MEYFVACDTDVGIIKKDKSGQPLKRPTGQLQVEQRLFFFAEEWANSQEKSLYALRLYTT